MTKVTPDDVTELVVPKSEKDENMQPPSAAALTYFNGAPPLEHLRTRMGEILQANPWLTCRLIKGRFLYSRFFDVSTVIDNHLLSVEVQLTGLDYQTLNEKLMPYVVKAGRDLKKDDPMFIVAIVEDTASAKESQFCLLCSINHVLADGGTFYKLYNMLSGDAKVEAMIPERIPGFDELKPKWLGKKEAAFFSCGLICGMLCGILKDVSLKKPRHTVFCEVDQNWLKMQKDAAMVADKNLSRISTNDVLTAWFFDQGGCDFGLMEVNLRGKDLNYGATELHAGNYTVMPPYFRGDFEPAIIRKSQQPPTGDGKRYKVQRTTGSRNKLGCCTNMGIITNWQMFYKTLVLPGCEETLHIPMMNLLNPTPSGTTACTIWTPRPGVVAWMLIETRKNNWRFPEKHPSYGRTVGAFPVHSTH